MNREQCWEYLIDWVDRMSKKYGGTVEEKNGKRWDWGQAIAREHYGPNWNNVLEDEPEIEELLLIVKKAKLWEEGNIPEWVKQERGN